jgi:hypothetical protein
MINNKPDFSKEIESKYYNFDSLDVEIYKWWEDAGYFKPIEKFDNK